MSSFSAPLRVGDRNDPDTMGNVVAVQQGVVDYTHVSEELMCVLPAPAEVIEIYVDVRNAFNAGTTNTLSISNGDDLTDTIDVSAVGRATVTLDVEELSFPDGGGVYATFTSTGTAATAGDAQITVLYIANKVLPD